MTNWIPLAVVAVIAVVVAGGGTYFATTGYAVQSYGGEITSLNTQISSLNQDLISLEEEKSNSGMVVLQTETFLKDYTIALVNIHRAITYLDLAIVNLEYGTDYVLNFPEEYEYGTAAAIFDQGMEQAADSKDLLLRGKTKLDAVKDDAPSPLFQQDIELRIQQADALLIVTENVHDLLRNTEREVYETNYGTPEMTQEYNDKFNEVTDEYNSNLKKLSDVQQKIDLLWDQDWYPAFRV